MDPYLNGLTLLGIPALVLVPLIIEALKTLGLPTRYAGIAAIATGILIAAAIEAIATWPTITPIIRLLITGTLLGLAASGTYSQYRTLTTKPKQEPQTTESQKQTKPP